MNTDGDGASHSELTSDEIASRYEMLQERVSAAAARSGRSADSVAILCVTKTHPASTVRAAYAAGLREFGENYVQEALGKQDEIAAESDTAGLPGARWHLIGHLQSNKTNVTAGRFSLIESVDSLKLGRRVGRGAEESGGVQDILIQLKLGAEETKSGTPPEEAVRLADGLQAVAGLRLRGLMAIAPLGPDGFLVKEPRPYFAEAKRVYDTLPAECREILSLGMSGDFECAIEEGSTLIRVGTTLLGSRPLRV